MLSKSLTLRKTREGLKYLYKSLLDFIYPPFCYACEERLKESERLICEKCWNSFKVYEGGIKIEKKDLRLLGKTHFSECYAIYNYNVKTLKLIHVFKYSAKSSLSVRMGKELGAVIKKNIFERKFDMIIPVPLHKSRERERGFNQSDLLSRVASSESGIPLFNDIVIRIKNNKSQSQLSFKERIVNVKNIFRVKHPEMIKDKGIILIDDIITTGLTVNSCCGELKKYGAKEIICMAVIHPVEK
ncbi:MAG: ComF family protein [Candidatus Helarchaeota archaeon]|nr:ComF family protein [Candidatus Helarchaeota archaeon]